MGCKFSTRKETKERFGTSFNGIAEENGKKYAIFYMDHILGKGNVANFYNSAPVVGEIEEEYDVEVSEGRYVVSDPDRCGLTSVVEPKIHKAKLYVLTWDLTEGKEPMKLYYLTETAAMFNMSYIADYIQSEIKIIGKVE